MPGDVEREIERRGGAIRYRTFTRGGKPFRVAVVRKPGPKGGHTVEWEIKDRPRKRGTTAGLIPPGGFWEWFIKGKAF